MKYQRHGRAVEYLPRDTHQEVFLKQTSEYNIRVYTAMSLLRAYSCGEMLSLVGGHLPHQATPSQTVYMRNYVGFFVGGRGGDRVTTGVGRIILY